MEEENQSVLEPTLQDIEDIPTLQTKEEEEGKRKNLLFYANKAIAFSIQDPILLDIAKKLSAYISQS